MKTKLLAILVAANTLTGTICSAQQAENVNPYAILGHTPYIAGAEKQSSNVFIIENFEEGSVVGKLEHNPQTGVVRFFDRNGSFMGDVQLSEEDRAFLSIDPRAEKYYNISPYAYVANNPTNAIDPDGKVVLFINGMYFDGTGGSKDYWGKNGSFATSIMTHFNDNNARYFDGTQNEYRHRSGVWGLGTNSNHFARINAGRAEGLRQAESIIGGLTKNEDGMVTEPIRVVTHSMGAAFGKGFIGALQDYITENPEIANGVQISEYDFAAFQQNQLWAIEGVPLYQYDNKGDKVVNGFIGDIFGSEHAKQKGATIYIPNVNPQGGHTISDFMNVIKSLPR